MIILTTWASQPVLVLQEGIVEEASDEEESPEQAVVRARKGKWVRKETSTLVDLPKGITRDTTVVTEYGHVGTTPTPVAEVTRQDEAESSRSRDVEIDLDPRIPEHVERAGAAEDTISVLVDAKDPTKVLKIGS